jgi:hypothetical protein
MLTDKRVRDVRFRFKIFQSRIYLSDAVESGMGENITSWREQESPWVYNTHEGVNAVADVLKQNIHILAVGPANVASYD